MTEAPETAGALLRAARERQGLHVAALATMLKVPPRKLEALEADRYEEFQGATFVRALALAACRTLKIDPAPVLERLPEQDTGTLSQLERGLNTPFRERDSRHEAAEAPLFGGMVAGLVLLLVVGALAFWLWPAGWRLPGSAEVASGVAEKPLEGAASGTLSVPVMLPAPEVAASEVGLASSAPPPWASPEGAGSGPASAASVPLAPAAQAVQQGSTPASAAPASAAPASVAAAAPPASGDGPLQIHASNASWVEVVDARGQVLVSRTLAQGEAVGFDGALPLHVKIGNVSGTTLSFRGKPVDLNALARDNVARLELK